MMGFKLGKKKKFMKVEWASYVRRQNAAEQTFVASHEDALIKSCVFYNEDSKAFQKGDELPQYLLKHKEINCITIKKKGM
eukprot:UN05802